MVNPRFIPSSKWQQNTYHLYTNPEALAVRFWGTQQDDTFDIWRCSWTMFSMLPAKTCNSFAISDTLTFRFVIISFYPNVTTLHSGLCYRESICHLSVCPSVRLSDCLSVMLMHPTALVEAFGNLSSPLCTLAILWPHYKILWRLSQGNPIVWGVKYKRGIKIEQCRTYRRLYLINGTR